MDDDHLILMRSCTMDSADSPLGSESSHEQVSWHLLGTVSLLKVNSFPMGVGGFLLMFSQKVIRIGWFCGGRYLLMKTCVESTTGEKDSFTSFSLAVAIFSQQMLIISLNSTESMWMLMDSMLLLTSSRIVLKSDYSFSSPSYSSQSLPISLLRASLNLSSSPQYCSFILAKTSIFSRQMSSKTALYLLSIRYLSVLASFLLCPIRSMTSSRDFRYCLASPTIREQASSGFTVTNLLPFWLSSTAQFSQYRHEGSPSTLNRPCFSRWFKQRLGSCINLASKGALGARTRRLSICVIRLDALGE